MRILFLLMISIASIAPAQIFSFGVKGGVPVTRAVPYDFSGFRVDTERWTVGPTVELHLPFKLSIEADALYRRYSTLNTIAAVSGPNALVLESHRAAGAWDIPLLLKYRLSEGAIRPFVDAGVQYTNESSDYTTRCISDSNACALTLLPSFGTSVYRAGPVGGAGLEFGRGRLRLAPEARYTHLNKPGTNQVTLLVGLTF